MYQLPSKKDQLKPPKKDGNIAVKHQNDQKTTTSSDVPHPDHKNYSTPVDSTTDQAHRNHGKTTTSSDVPNPDHKNYSTHVDSTTDQAHRNHGTPASGGYGMMNQQGNTPKPPASLDETIRLTGKIFPAVDINDDQCWDFGDVS